MIRERRIASPQYSQGQVISVELPKDAVYHQIQVELDGNISLAYPVGGVGAGATQSRFAQGFPFNLMSRLRLIRNGSDVVWQGSGKQLAKEALYLNGVHPFARMWVDPSSALGTANSLLLQTINGIVVPSNPEGIGANAAAFQDASVAGQAVATTNVIAFRMMVEMWLQLGVEDNYFTTLVDARPLASYTLEITWESMANIVSPGGQPGFPAVVTPTVSCSVQSYDQDNLSLGIAFGTFKRASFQPPGLSYSSSQIQALLPRGNLYYGVLFEALGYKSAGGSFGATPTIAEPGNDIIGEIQNRINSNYQLRDVYFRDLQAKNRNDNRVPTNPYDPWAAAPFGWAMFFYPCTGDSIKELVATYTMDQFDLLLQIAAQAGVATSDGFTYQAGTTPIVNLLTQEVIPGKSVSPSGARGSFAGSISATSAKPGV